MKETIVLSAGKYVVGDPSWFMVGWKDFLMNYNYDKNGYLLPSFLNSLPFAMFQSKISPGTVKDKKSEKLFGVFSGYITAIPIEAVNIPRISKLYKQFIHFHNFNWSFDAYESNGIIVFGDIEIDTNNLIE